MKNKLIRFFKNYHKAFIPVSNGVITEVAGMKELVSKKIAEVNCRRIIAVFPLLLAMSFWHVYLSLRCETKELFQYSMIVSCALVLFLCMIVGASIWVIYLNKIDNQLETWKLKWIYRIFWTVWFALTEVISLLQSGERMGRVVMIVSCVIVNIMPLYSLTEFIFHSVVVTMMSVLMLFSITEVVTVETQLLITCFIAMQIIGFIAQRTQMVMWMSQEYLYIEAFVDPLTGLLNRRGANVTLKEEVENAATDRNVGVIMFDIDYFKKYNDTFGHDAGDVCLSTVGKTITERLSERTKLLIRHGGEEFVAIILDTNKEELLNLAETLRNAVYEKRMEAPVKEIADYVTVSVGSAIAKLDSMETRYENLLKEADEALYKAKKAGRNRVVFAE